MGVRLCDLSGHGIYPPFTTGNITRYLLKSLKRLKEMKKYSREEVTPSSKAVPLHAMEAHGGGEEL
jgi:hypothetical protein